MARKRIKEGIFGNNWMNYLTKFDQLLDIVLIIYMFYEKIFLKVDMRK